MSLIEFNLAFFAPFLVGGLRIRGYIFAGTNYTRNIVGVFWKHTERNKDHLPYNPVVVWQHLSLSALFSQIVADTLSSGNT